MTPILSVIVPAYNCASYLHECLESIRCQLTQDCELIVVDDGSTDGTPDILASYDAAYDNVKALYCEHKGASGARNAGLEAASGSYIAFTDCDDVMKPGFIAESRHLMEQDIDLCIFGIERVPLSGNSEFWTTADKRYPSASAFADTYIRNRNLLVYSNCNKYYRKAVIDKRGLRFDEASHFGEDRLFNYAFIKECGSIVTSSIVMLSYLQRSMDSLSSRHVEQYYTRAVSLHEAKMACFLGLSKGTTEAEKAHFRAYDLSRETEIAIERFAEHPEERIENLPRINARLFGGSDGVGERIDVLVVLGSRNCGYKAKRAVEIGAANPGMTYIVSGGNPYRDGTCTEAEYMASYLKGQGVADEAIYLENHARYTKQNLLFSAAVIASLRKEGRQVRRIGILTAGFHVLRTRMLAESIESYQGEDITYFSAYGPNTGREDWFSKPKGRAIVLGELRKTVKLECEMGQAPAREACPTYISLAPGSARS